MKNTKILFIISAILFFFTFLTKNYSQTDNLLLWNKLGSQIEIENSEIGINGTIVGTDIINEPVMFDDGATRTIASSSMINFEDIQLGLDKGCIEFWSKMTEAPGSATSHVNWFSESSTINPQINFYWDKNYDHGDVSISYGSGGHSNRIRFHHWNADDIGWTAAGDIIHFSVVWDMDLPYDDCIKLYADGNRVTGIGYMNGAGSQLVLKTSVADDLAILTLHGNTNADRKPNCSMDNIKVWDYPKNDFSDRFYEGVVVKLLDHNGDGLSGGTVKYYESGWQTIGETNEDGLIYFNYQGSHENLSFKMTYEGYTQQLSNQDISNPVVFQTTLMAVDLLNSSSVGIADGIVRYYASGWKDLGTTDINGEVFKELLPGSYSFKMTYAGYTQQISNVDITSTNPLTYQTLNMVVRLEDSGGSGIADGAVKYYASGWKDFGTTASDGNAPDFELLPGTYSFKMTYQGATEQKSNIDITTTNPLVFNTGSEPMVVKLLDSVGNGIEGGIVKYYASGWKDFGTTDVNGEVAKDLLPGTYSFKMTYAGYTQKISNVNISTINPLIYQTVNMLVRLEDSGGNGIADGLVKYYASGWKDFGTTVSDGNTPGVELLPGTYSFKMTYEGSTEQKSSINITTTNPLVFNTGSEPMVVKLLDSVGNGIEGGVVKYYASGWKDFGTTDVNGEVSKDLLPGTYSFKMTYAGYTQQISNVEITATNPLVYQTLNMVVRLEDSGGSGIADGVVKYYASGWKDFGTTSGDGNTPSVELLPATYSFKMTYEGSTEQKSNIDITTTNPLVFCTGSEPMVVKLLDSGGNAIEGGVVKYYASGWKDFGTTDVNGEVAKDLLPGSYSFKMTYAGYTEKKSNINITTNNPLVYQTVNMTVTLKGSDDGLLLWNKLGNNTEVVNSEVGPNGTITGTLNYYSTMFADGAQPSSGGSGHCVYYDATIIDPEKGCLEFWYQNFSQPQGVNRPGHEFHGMINSPFDGSKDQNLGIDHSRYNGNPSYGVTFRFNKSPWRNIQVTEQIPLGLHHIAVVWDRNGITGSNDYMRLYLDAAIKGTQTTYNDWGTSSTGIIKVAVNRGTFNPPPTQCYSVDNLKIWDYAKSDFSDRFSENGLENATIKYYASGWKDFGITDQYGNATLELLPGTYSFKATYKGYTQQKSGVNIAVTNPLEYETVSVYARLENTSDGSGIPDGIVKYYASGWKDFDTTAQDGNTSRIELLPGSYSFKMDYNGEIQQLTNVDITTTNPVVFQTTQLAKKAAQIIADSEVPTEYNLLNNYPNPFNPNTQIKYQLPDKSFVTVKIYNVMGQEINTLVNQIKEPGTYQLTFGGDQLSSGIYYCILKANDYRETIKMILLK